MLSSIENPMGSGLNKGVVTTFLFCCVFEVNLCISLGNDQGHRATHKGGKTFEHKYLAQWCSVLGFLWIYTGWSRQLPNAGLALSSNLFPIHLFAYKRAAGGLAGGLILSSQVSDLLSMPLLFLPYRKGKMCVCQILSSCLHYLYQPQFSPFKLLHSL